MHAENMEAVGKQQTPKVMAKHWNKVGSSDSDNYGVITSDRRNSLPSWRPASISQQQQPKRSSLLETRIKSIERIETLSVRSFRRFDLFSETWRSKRHL